MASSLHGEVPSDLQYADHLAKQAASRLQVRRLYDLDNRACAAWHRCARIAGLLGDRAYFDVSPVKARVKASDLSKEGVTR